MLGFAPQVRAIKKEARAFVSGSHRDSSGGGKEVTEGSESDDEDGDHREISQSPWPRKIPPTLPIDSHKSCKSGITGKSSQSPWPRKIPIELTTKIDSRNLRKPGITGTLIFVGNLPFMASTRWLRATFQKFGPIGDVFIPNRLSRGFERKFGFVRFLSEKDADRAIHNLDGSLVGNWNLIVQRSKPKYELVISKGSGSWVSSSSDLSFSRGFTYDPVNGVSCQDNEASDSKKRVLGVGKFRDWVHCAALAYLRKGMSFIEIRSMILESCSYVKSISLIRDYSVLIVFQSSSHRDSAIEQGIWSHWFYSVKGWDVDKEGKENKIWVECVGIPFHAWNEVTFESIASVWGSIMEVDSETSNMVQVSTARMCISTSVSAIDEIIELEVDGSFFDIHVFSCSDQGKRSSKQVTSRGGGNNQYYFSKANSDAAQTQSGSKHMEGDRMVQSRKCVNQCCAFNSCSSNSSLNTSESHSKSIYINLTSAADYPKITVEDHGSVIGCIFGTPNGKDRMQYNQGRHHSEMEAGILNCLKKCVPVDQEERIGMEVCVTGGVQRNQLEGKEMMGKDVSFNNAEMKFQEQDEADRFQAGEGYRDGVEGEGNKMSSFKDEPPGMASEIIVKKKKEVLGAVRIDSNSDHQVETEIVDNKVKVAVQDLGSERGVQLDSPISDGKVGLHNTCCRSQLLLKEGGNPTGPPATQEVSIGSDPCGRVFDAGGSLLHQSGAIGKSGIEAFELIKGPVLGSRNQSELEGLNSMKVEAIKVQPRNEGKSTVIPLMCNIISGQSGNNGVVSVEEVHVGHSNNGEVSPLDFNIDVFDSVIIKGIEANSNNLADQADRGDKVDAYIDEIPSIPNCKFAVTREFINSSINISTDVLVECRIHGIRIPENDQRAIVKAMTKRHIQAEIDFYAVSKD